MVKALAEIVEYDSGLSHPLRAVVAEGEFKGVEFCMEAKRTDERLVGTLALVEFEPADQFARLAR